MLRAFQAFFVSTWGRWRRPPEGGSSVPAAADVSSEGTVKVGDEARTGRAADIAGASPQTQTEHNPATVVAEPEGRVTVDPALRQQTLEALQNLKQIPALQSLAQAFSQTAARTDVDVADVVKSIEKDSALCVRVLGMANSVGVGSERRVEDLATAVQLLGVMRVRRLAQAMFTMRDSQRMAEGVDWRHLWVHAFATAAIAEELEQRLRPAGWGAADEESPVYLAALLHDVGKIVLSTVVPESYREVMAAAWNGTSRLEELELKRLGLTHREAGAIFAEHHRLPAVVVGAIRHHGEAEAADERWRFEVAVVTLANFLSKAHGLGFSGARLGEGDGEFADQPAWEVIAAAGGQKPSDEELDRVMGPFLGRLREELKVLRAGE